ncbi:hypothetical protein HMPREF1549_00178, partial [Actinomyces johnsonii F0510]
RQPGPPRRLRPLGLPGLPRRRLPTLGERWLPQRLAPQPHRRHPGPPGRSPERLEEIRVGGPMIEPPLPLHEAPEKHADPRYTVSGPLWGGTWLACSWAL